jgi:hypothetical protein
LAISLLGAAAYELGKRLLAISSISTPITAMFRFSDS